MSVCVCHTVSYILELYSIICIHVTHARTHFWFSLLNCDGNLFLCSKTPPRDLWTWTKGLPYGPAAYGYQLCTNNISTFIMMESHAQDGNMPLSVGYALNSSQEQPHFISLNIVVQTRINVVHQIFGIYWLMIDTIAIAIVQQYEMSSSSSTSNAFVNRMKNRAYYKYNGQSEAYEHIILYKLTLLKNIRNGNHWAFNLLWGHHTNLADYSN